MHLEHVTSLTLPHHKLHLLIIQRRQVNKDVCYLLFLTPQSKHVALSYFPTRYQKQKVKQCEHILKCCWPPVTFLWYIQHFYFVNVHIEQLGNMYTTST